MHLWQKIFIGLVLGIIFGFLFPDYAVNTKFIGDIFINLIKMIIIPVVLFSIMSAISNIELKDAGIIGIKSSAIYLFTTVVAVALGLVVATISDIGEGINLNFDIGEQKKIDLLSVNNFFPSNIFEAFASNNVIQVIFIAIIFGVAMKSKNLKDIVTSLSELSFKVTEIVLKFSPYGVFSLMAFVVATNHIDVLESLIGFVGVVVIACLTHILIIGFMVSLVRNPFQFFKKILPAQLLAFSTSSSSATLPLTMRIAKEKLGIKKEVASFTLPLGTTINMDGTALYQGICAVYIANAVGIDLTMFDFIIIVFTAVIASIGSAGVPGTGFVMLGLVLSSIGLPVEAVAVIAGVDRILDMLRTVVNVTGDLMVASLVDKD